MELLIAKGGSDVDRNYTTYFNDMSDEERDAERQTVPILFEDFSSRIKEENNGTRNSVCSHHLGISWHLGINGFQLKWQLKKNQNPGVRFGATSKTVLPIQPVWLNF